MDNTPLFQVQSTYDFPKLRLLPLREQPAYRVAQNADACNLAELLAAIVGGQNQIEIAEDLLKRFGGLRGLYQAHVAEIGSVKGPCNKLSAVIVHPDDISQGLKSVAISI